MKTAVKITKDAKNGVFDQCLINGALQNSGKEMKFVRTSIGFANISKNHPILYGIISAIIGGGITLLIEYTIFK